MFSLTPGVQFTVPYDVLPTAGGDLYMSDEVRWDPNAVLIQGLGGIDLEDFGHPGPSTTIPRENGLKWAISVWVPIGRGSRSRSSRGSTPYPVSAVSGYLGTPDAPFFGV